MFKLLLLALLACTSNAHYECEAPEPNEGAALALSAAARHRKKIENAGGRRLRPVVDVVIPTIYHIVEDEDTVGFTTDARIQDQHVVLNAAFAGTGFSYELAGITRTVNNEWAVPFPGSPEEQEMKAFLHQGDFDVLNVYVVRLPFGFGGYASLPTLLLLDGPEQDGVVVNAEFLPGGTFVTNNLGQVLAHEVGHWHDLYHTFQGSCDSEFGDFIDDTPQEAAGVFGCPSGPIDTCPDDPGNDPRSNFMSYSDDICYEEFSPGQIDRMHTSWEYFRTGSNAPACTKLCKLMIPDYFNNLGQCRKAMCRTNGNIKGDTCNKATKLKVGKPVTGSTVNAGLDENAPSCQGVDIASPGVWYKFKGDGGLYRASTCGFSTLLLDAQISVYKGGCDTLTCVNANDNSPTCTDFRAEVAFVAEQGEWYYLLVHGFGFPGVFSTEGAYEIVIDEIPKESCYYTGLPGCDDMACQDSVCGSNPFCCDVGWDISCVELACASCTYSDVPVLCETCPSATGTLQVDITTDFFPEETTWEVQALDKGGPAVLATGGPYEEGFTDYQETADLCTSDCYEFKIFDAFGDGICCAFGLGTYSITWDGVTIPSPSGGAYGSSETIQFGSCPP